MKALTLKQPWADMLFCQHPAFADPNVMLKSLETRKWKSSYRGRLLITTSQKPDKFYRPIPELLGICRHCGCTYETACPNGCYWVNDNCDLCSVCIDKELYGYAIGIVDMVDCFVFKPEHVIKAACEWYNGYCFKFENAVRLPEPVPIKGKLNIWESDIELTAGPIKKGALIRMINN